MAKRGRTRIGGGIGVRISLTAAEVASLDRLARKRGKTPTAFLREMVGLLLRMLVAGDLDRPKSAARSTRDRGTVASRRRRRPS